MLSKYVLDILLASIGLIATCVFIGYLIGTNQFYEEEKDANPCK